MKNNKLHIVLFDVPYPPDYGGVIDVYYKIKALHDAGIEIYLHCFAYGREESPILYALCKKVWYYERKTGLSGVSLLSPYIVNSRKNELLLKHLQEIDAPILFEGAHTTSYLSHSSLKNRKKAVRIHNVEATYYKQLAKKEGNLFKKLYYQLEASLLNRYELKFNSADSLFSLSIEDDKYFASLYPHTKHQFIGPFHANEKVASFSGIGSYCLYHGNLSHPENIEVVLYLLKKVVPNIHVPFIIAGREPSESIIKSCKALSNCTLVANPGAAEMLELVQQAQIHVMPTFQISGMKLKLLNALYNGRHVIANEAMLYGSGLNELCAIAEDSDIMINAINTLFQKPFSATDIAHRNAVLEKHYNNQYNAQKIITWMQE